MTEFTPKWGDENDKMIDSFGAWERAIMLCSLIFFVLFSNRQGLLIGPGVPREEELSDVHQLLKSHLQDSWPLSQCRHLAADQQLPRIPRGKDLFTLSAHSHIEISETCGSVRLYWPVGQHVCTTVQCNSHRDDAATRSQSRCSEWIRF